MKAYGAAPGPGGPDRPDGAVGAPAYLDRLWGDALAAFALAAFARAPFARAVGPNGAATTHEPHEET